VALIKRILLFLASLVFTIVLLIGATTGFAKDEFEADIKEPNFRFYTIEWIDEADDNGRRFVCGTKVTTYDYSGRKFVMEYYYLLTNENKIVTRFELDAVQISFEAIEPLKTESLAIKLHGSVINKDGEEILAGIRGPDEEYKGIATEYNELDLIGNTEIFKLLYRGGYNIEAYIMPHSSTVIPIAKNQLYNENSEETLIRCIVDLMDNHEANKSKGEVFSENAYRTG